MAAALARGLGGQVCELRMVGTSDDGRREESS